MHLWDSTQQLTIQKRTAWFSIAAVSLTASLFAASCTPVAQDESQPQNSRPAAAARPPASSNSVHGVAPGKPKPDPKPPAPSKPSPTTTTPTSTGSTTSFVTKGERLGVGGCPVFPRDNAFHADIGKLPVRADSAAVIKAEGASEIVRAGFSANVWEGSRKGVPINIADSHTDKLIDFLGTPTSSIFEHKGHPIPKNPRLEGWPGIAWDRHLLVVDTATCISSEFFYVTPASMNPAGYWVAQKAVKLDLRSNASKGRGTTVASGLSLLSGMVRYDEVASGRIDHVIAMSLPKVKDAPAIWPAFATDGRSSDPNAPAMGSWFRLRADADLSALGPEARIVAKALQEHGAVLTDTNFTGMALRGEPDTRWDDKDLATLKKLTLTDFEVVDASPMMVNRSSLQIR